MASGTCSREPLPRLSRAAAGPSSPQSRRGGRREPEDLGRLPFPFQGFPLLPRTESVTGDNTLYFNRHFHVFGGLCKPGLIKAPAPGLLSAVLQVDGIRDRGIKRFVQDALQQQGHPSPASARCLLSLPVGSCSAGPWALCRRPAAPGNPRCPLLASGQPTASPARGPTFPGRGGRGRGWIFGPGICSHGACGAPQGCHWLGASGRRAWQGRGGWAEMPGCGEGVRSAPVLLGNSSRSFFGSVNS